MGRSGIIWGVCFARQFLFERAKDCFEHALEYTPDRRDPETGGAGGEADVWSRSVIGNDKE